MVQIRKAPQVLQNVVTYDVVISASNAELVLLPGMTANVRIVTDQKELALQVPNAALRFRPPGMQAEQAQRGGGTGGKAGGAPGQAGPRPSAQAGARGRVWTLGADGQPKQIALQLGISDGTSTEVTEGPLEEGAQVIVGLAGSDRPVPGGGATGGPRLRL